MLYIGSNTDSNVIGHLSGRNLPPSKIPPDLMQLLVVTVRTWPTFCTDDGVDTPCLLHENSYSYLW